MTSLRILAVMMGSILLASTLTACPGKKVEADRCGSGQYWNVVLGCLSIGSQRSAQGPLVSITRRQVCFGFAGGPRPVGKDGKPLDTSLLRTCFRLDGSLDPAGLGIGTYYDAAVDSSATVWRIQPHTGPLPN